MIENERKEKLKRKIARALDRKVKSQMPPTMSIGQIQQWSNRTVESFARMIHTDLFDWLEKELDCDDCDEKIWRMYKFSCGLVGVPLDSEEVF